MSSINSENGTASERSADKSAKQIVYRRVKPGPIRRFFRSIFSHIFFALAVLGAVFGSLFYFGYLEDSRMLHTAGNYVCAPERLGRYVAGSSSSLAQKSDQGTPARTAMADQKSANGEKKAAIKKAAKNGAASNNQASPKKAQKEKQKTAAIPVEKKAAKTVAVKLPVEKKKMASKSAEAGIAKTGEGAVTVSTEAKGTTSSVPASKLKDVNQAGETTRRAFGSKADELTTGKKKKSDSTKPVKKRKSLGAAWKEARAAYVAKDAAAIPAYKALIKENPHIADLPGELGNIYYNEGKFELAANQYMEAAIRHLKGPRPAFASCLIEVLERISPERAKKLKSLTEDECPR